MNCMAPIYPSPHKFLYILGTFYVGSYGFIVNVLCVGSSCLWLLLVDIFSPVIRAGLYNELVTTPPWRSLVRGLLLCISVCLVLRLTWAGLGFPFYLVYNAKLHEYH